MATGITAGEFLHVAAVEQVCIDKIRPRTVPQLSTFATRMNTHGKHCACDFDGVAKFPQELYLSGFCNEPASVKLPVAAACIFDYGVHLVFT
jgi:hypothetical protein